MRYLFFAFVLFSASLTCRGSILRSNGPVTLEQEGLFVTHASAVFTQDEKLRANVDAVIAGYKASNKPVIYIMNEDDGDDSNWLPSDKNPSFAIDSRNGDHEVSVRAGQVTVVGGLLTLCLDRTLEAIIRSAEKNGLKKLTVSMPLDSIYEDKSIFAATGNVPFKDLEILFAVKEYRTLKFYREHLGRNTFLKALKSYFEEKGQISYEVRMDGKSLMKNPRPGKMSVSFNLI